MSLDVRISRAGVLRVSASDETTRWGLEAWAGQEDPTVEVALDGAGTLTLRQQPAPAEPTHPAWALAEANARAKKAEQHAEELQAKLQEAEQRAALEVDRADREFYRAEELQEKLDSLLGKMTPAKPGYPPIMNRSSDDA